MLDLIGFLWQNGLERPMINGLIALSTIFAGSFGLAIIALTIVMKGATWPLTLKQLRSTRAMQSIQPRLQEVQKKYKDPRRRSEETMKLYREAGINPFGCVVPMLVQFPIWIALYRSLVVTVGGTPERLVDLSQLIYGWRFLQDAIPLASHFLWMDLGKPDMVLPGIVGVSTWAQTKMTQTRSTDPRSQSMNSMMLWMMPLMFAWFSLTVPSGLALYWLMTNLIGIVMNYFVFGWGGLKISRGGFSPATMLRAVLRGPETVESGAVQPSPAAAPRGRKSNGRGGGRRKNR